MCLLDPTGKLSPQLVCAPVHRSKDKERTERMHPRCMCKTLRKLRGSWKLDFEFELGRAARVKTPSLEEKIDVLVI